MANKVQTKDKLLEIWKKVCLSKTIDILAHAISFLLYFTTITRIKIFFLLIFNKQKFRVNLFAKVSIIQLNFSS